MGRTGVDISRQPLSARQHASAVDDNRTQHIRLIFAIHRLEACLGQAAPTRESNWLRQVGESLDLLVAAMAESQECVDDVNGLIEGIRLKHPELHGRINNLRSKFMALTAQAKSFLEQLSVARGETNISFTDVRWGLDRLISGLKHHQAMEADLVYEVVKEDIGVNN